MESGDSWPQFNYDVFIAKDLPKTRLSNHIEQRLFRHLKEEREERAKVTGKCFDEVRSKNLFHFSYYILLFYIYGVHVSVQCASRH